MDKFASLVGVGLLLVASFFALSRMADSRPALYRVTSTVLPAPRHFADFGAAKSDVYRLLARTPAGGKVALYARSAPGKSWRLWREWVAK